MDLHTLLAAFNISPSLSNTSMRFADARHIAALLADRIASAAADKPLYKTFSDDAPSRRGDILECPCIP